MKDPMRSLILSLFLFLSMGSCVLHDTPLTSSRTYSTSNKDLSVVENNETNLTLDNYLRQVAGVNVNGNGANASVTIRGISSFSASNEPLMIVDGLPVSSFTVAYTMVNQREIKSVRVLKNPVDTGIYGVRGTNGIIIITRKAVN